MPEGVIAGGWSYVIAAYAITAVGLAGYALSLVARLKRANLEDSVNQEDTQP